MCHHPPFDFISINNYYYLLSVFYFQFSHFLSKQKLPFIFYLEKPHTHFLKMD
jgi:hypothetical protein